MPIAVFICPGGKKARIEVAVGTSLMRAAQEAGIDAIVGECGGALACATCHVIVDDAFASLVGPPHEKEGEMLDYTAAFREPTSRLSCQIVMTEALGGVTVRIADPQV